MIKPRAATRGFALSVGLEVLAGTAHSMNVQR
jgi:hypothetical protein